MQIEAFRRLAADDRYSPEQGVTHDLAQLAPGLRAADFGDGANSMFGGSSERSFSEAGKDSGRTQLIRKLSSIASSMQAGGGGQRSGGDPDDSGRKWPTSWAQQMVVLFARAMKVRRFEALSMQTLVLMVGVGTISGMFYWQTGGSDNLAAVRDTSAVLFFECLFMTINSAFTSVFVFPKDKAMVIKERSSGMYRLSAYYLARTLSDLPMECAYPSIFVILVYFLSGLRLSAGAFFANWLSTMLSLLTSQSTGLMIGAGISNGKNALTLAGIVMLTLMLAGGFFVTNVPIWLSWIRYINYISYSYNILLHIEFQGRSIVDCSQPLPDGTCPPVEDLRSGLGLWKDPNQSVLSDVLILFAMMLILRTAVYVILARSTKQKGGF